MSLFMRVLVACKLSTLIYSGPGGGTSKQWPNLYTIRLLISVDKLFLDLCTHTHAHTHTHIQKEGVPSHLLPAVAQAQKEQAASAAQKKKEQKVGECWGVYLCMQICVYL